MQPSRRISLALLLSAALFDANANGVLVVDASRPVCASLVSSEVRVSIENQVAITRTTQLFKNTTSLEMVVKYAFPLPEGASATKLQWKFNDEWFQANFSATAQDTTLPGGTTALSLSQYLGAKPLYFGIEKHLKPDSVLTVELTYVQLLPYRNGVVSYSYPNDYRRIQSAPLTKQLLDVTLVSQRTIVSAQLVSHQGAVVLNNGTNASVAFQKDTAQADANYLLRYSLSATELGLFSLSTKIPDSLGYFTFIVEPDPGSTQVIRKNFMVIIDRSGSMGGTKITQAVNAATYIVNNLNDGDAFNIVDFDDLITVFRDTLVPYTSTTRDQALQYIGSLYARGNTDIAAAFSRAVPQFRTVSDTVANLIVFLTDGQATSGLTNTDAILARVDTLMKQVGRQIFVFTFGIGSDVNRQLLTILASNNGGLAEFLGNDQLESRITDFYNIIRNPLLINPKVSFSSSAVEETYPSPLPNLYKGQQLTLAGIYRSAPPPVDVTFSGTAFGRPVSYQYSLSLSDTAIERVAFIPKLWAKLKIEFLLVRYYSAPPGSGVAKELKDAIIQLSLAYGVISPFTSFSGGGGSTEVESKSPVVSSASSYRLLGNYPNPFNPGTTIRFRILNSRLHSVLLKIYNIQGQLVRILDCTIHGEGEYRVYWDGRNERGQPSPSGIYLYVVDFGDGILGGRMLLVK